VNKEFAQRWIDSFFSDETPAGLYAEGGVCEDALLDLRIPESAREEWKTLCAAWANKEVMGDHTMLVTDYLGPYTRRGSDGREERIGVIHWVWECDLPEFLGLPTGGKKINTTCMSVQIYNDEGKIVHDWTTWDAINMLKQCGVPLKTPHFWEMDWLTTIDGISPDSIVESFQL